MRAIGKVRVHPCGSLRQGHSTRTARFCSAIFRVSKYGSLQYVHFWIFCLQLLHMLCPLPHNAMGGTMYCMQAGHSSLSSTSLDREYSCFSDDYCLKHKIITYNFFSKTGITAAQQNATHGKCSEKLRDTNKVIERKWSIGFNWKLTLPYETTALHIEKCTVLLSTKVRTSNISSKYLCYWRIFRRNC